MVIEARRFHRPREFSSDDEFIEYSQALADWCGGEFDPHLSSIFIVTLEGTMRATLGNYIIEGVQGEFYPCEANIFHSTYERVD